LTFKGGCWHLFEYAVVNGVGSSVHGEKLAFPARCVIVGGILIAQRWSICGNKIHAMQVRR